MFRWMVVLLGASLMTTIRAASPVAEPSRVVLGAAGVTTVLRESHVWRSGVRHELAGPVLIEAQGTLVIEAGARIEARPGAGIVVSRDGRIIAEGTALQPIVMTCTSEPRYAGCWNGLSIRGFAGINFGTITSPPARESGAAGCRESVSNGQPFGGCADADSSGALRYVRIEYAANGLELLGVGHRTRVEDIQVNRSASDGVRVVGGTVDVRQLFLTANSGYGLAWRAGWRGRGQFISVQQDSLIGRGGISGSNASSETDGPAAFVASPRSAPALFNVTVIAPSAATNPASALSPSALHLRQGTSGTLRNVLVYGAVNALDLDDEETCLDIDGRAAVDVQHVVIAATGSNGAGDGDPFSCLTYGGGGNVEAQYLADAARRVLTIDDPLVAAELIRNAFDLAIPDLRPPLEGATVTNPAAAPPDDGFFDVAALYAGALPPNTAARNVLPWYSGWTVPAPRPPLPGTVTGIVASATRGPLDGALITSALGVSTTSALDGSYTLALPAGAHTLTPTGLPVGCGAAVFPVVVPSGSAITADVSVDCSTIAFVSVGGAHACALSTLGRAQCWGDNEFGTVGDGTVITPRVLPSLVAGNRSFAVGTLSSGYSHTCAIEGTRALCWGLNFFGALGVGSTGLFSTQPVVVGTSATPAFTQVATGGYHACALTSTGVAWCWGWNQEGQAGQPASTTALVTPAPVSAGPLSFSQVTAGDSHSCALTAAGEAWCWGGNGRGELGTDPAIIGAASSTPVLVPGGLVFTSLDAGAFHTCGVTATGAVYCWGSQEFGQLGNGVVSAATSGPVLVSGASDYIGISAGGGTTCGVTTDRTVRCWGAGQAGALGDGTNVTAQATPVSIAGAVAEVGGVVVGLGDPSATTVCAHTLDGDAFCWGAGARGQLGNGGLTSSNVPVQVLVRGPS